MEPVQEIVPEERAGNLGKIQKRHGWERRGWLDLKQLAGDVEVEDAAVDQGDEQRTVWQMMEMW
jgi:hypothetical protein